MASAQCINVNVVLQFYGARVNVLRSLCVRLMPAVLRTLKERKDLLTNEIYLLSAVTALQRVSETLPHFISPYLQDTIAQVSITTIFKAHASFKALYILQLNKIFFLCNTVGHTFNSASGASDVLPSAPCASHVSQQHTRHKSAIQGPYSHHHQMLL